MEKKKEVFLAARVSPEMKKQFTIYAAQHDSSMQAILTDYVQTLLELSISPSEAITAIRERAQKKPGEK